MRAHLYYSSREFDAVSVIVALVVIMSQLLVATVASAVFGRALSKGCYHAATVLAKRAQLR